MSRSFTPRLSRNQFYSAVVGTFVLIVVIHSIFSPAYGAELGRRQLQLTNNNPGALSSYDLSFNLSTAGILGSIEIQFCANDPLLGSPCVAPTGFSDTNAILSSQSGQTDFAIASSSTMNQIILARTPTAGSIGPVTYNFSGITNPNVTGPYYVRLQTFASNDATGNSSDYGGIAFDVINSFSITAEVPPYLVFCTGTSIPQYNCDSAIGDFINFGDLSATTTSSGKSQMLTATNAKNGYSITAAGTTMESGNNIINALASNDVSRPGTAQFGFNLVSNSSPVSGNNPSGPGSGSPTANYGTPNFYRFVSGEIVASNQKPDNVREYTVSYIVNVPQTQPAGFYASTMTYICLANF
jgi:hypothetical protein